MAITTEFSAALNQVCAERGISKEAVLETIESALVSAYRKDFSGPLEELRAEVDPETGKAKIFKHDEDVTPEGFGRIAAQTAKQVILQRIREKEKDAIIEEYRKRIGTIVAGHIFRIEKNTPIIDLGRAQGYLLSQEQISTEQYQLNQRLKALVKDVREGVKGPEIILTRADPKFVERLFEMEVPELHAGTVKIEVIAREAGSRTKMAVSSSEENIDPVGSCVGQKGVRVQSVIAELGAEKIDIIPYSEEPDKFIASALSPAKVTSVSLSSKKKEAKVNAPEDQLSLAIGKGGQNVRLAAKLTGWRIDIKGVEAEKEAKEAKGKVAIASELEKLGLSKRVAAALERAGIKTKKELKSKPEKELKEIKGLGPKAMEEIGKVVGEEE